MHLLLATLTTVLGADPAVAVVKRSAVGVSDEAVAVVMRTVSEGLRVEGLEVQSASITCSGDRPCLAELAKSLKVEAVVGVTIIRGRRDITVDLEAVDGNQRQIAVQTFSVPNKGQPFPPEGAAFFNSVSRGMKVKDTPVAVN